MKTPLIIYWFRRDLRLHDNRALFEALQNGCPVLPLFIFDTYILDKLPDQRDKRVGFIYHAISKLQDELVKMGSSLLVLHGKPLDIFQQLQHQYAISAVYANHDYEPDAIKRDSAISDLLKSHNIRFETYKDQVIFEKAEVLKPDGTPYTVFTPYSKRWKQQLTEETVKSFPSQDYLMHLYKTNPFHFPALTAIGFADAGNTFEPARIDENKIRLYHETRDFPSLNGTSGLSVHLRFGTVSIFN
jgi:deoxyribodipyrimidine photo-lyase